MNEEQNNKKPLYFPTNCPDANDYVAGFGSKELIITIIAFFVAVIVAIFLYISYSSMPLALIIAASIVVITVLVTKRNAQQESLIDQLIQVIKYSRAQKIYLYEYFNIYEEN